MTLDENGVFQVDPASGQVYGHHGFALAGVEDGRLVFGSERIAHRELDDRNAGMSPVPEPPIVSGDVVGLEPVHAAEVGAMTVDELALTVRILAERL